MSNAAHVAVSAGNKFRQVAREATNPSTKLLAEGVRELVDAMSHLEKQIHSVRP